MNRLYDSYLTMALGCSTGLLIGLALSLLFAWPVQLLWNWLLPELFNLPEITFLQAWGLELLCRMLLGGRITINKQTSKQVEQYRRII
jgi:hypothetical protein